MEGDTGQVTFRWYCYWHEGFNPTFQTEVLLVLHRPTTSTTKSFTSDVGVLPILLFMLEMFIQ